VLRAGLIEGEDVESTRVYELARLGGRRAGVYDTFIHCRLVTSLSVRTFTVSTVPNQQLTVKQLSVLHSTGRGLSAVDGYPRG
jgi:hypothetical protein